MKTITIEDKIYKISRKQFIEIEEAVGNIKIYASKDDTLHTAWKFVYNNLLKVITTTKRGEKIEKGYSYL